MGLTIDPDWLPASSPTWRRLRPWRPWCSTSPSTTKSSPPASTRPDDEHGPLDGSAAESPRSSTPARSRPATSRAGRSTDRRHRRTGERLHRRDGRPRARRGGRGGRAGQGRREPAARGVPYAVKNLCDLEGVVTRAGSRINRDNPAAAHDATVVAKLKAAGAVCLGALNMGEYAYDFTGRNVHDGDVRNPHDLSRMAGGSSSGSGAAVAAAWSRWRSAPTPTGRSGFPRPSAAPSA